MDSMGTMNHSLHSMHDHAHHQMAVDSSAVDHSQHMDHSEHADHMDMGHMMEMSMSFHFSKSATVLFDQWTFKTVGGLIGSMIGIFIMAAVYEGLKYFREYLFWRTYNSLQYKSVSTPKDKTAPAPEETQVVQVIEGFVHKKPPTMLSKMHFLQTFLHMVQMILSYFLMLIFMTYNTWLCIAIVLGAGVGYFLFGWKKSVVVDVTEHCH